MSFIEKIKKDMYKSMKESNKQATSTLRILLSELKEKSIEKKEDLTNDESIKIIKPQFICNLLCLSLQIFAFCLGQVD